MNVQTVQFVDASDIFAQYDIGDIEIEVDSFSVGDAEITLVGREEFAAEVAGQLGVSPAEISAKIPDGVFVNVEG